MPQVLQFISAYLNHSIAFCFIIGISTFSFVLISMFIYTIAYTLHKHTQRPFSYIADTNSEVGWINATFVLFLDALFIAHDILWF